MGKSIFIVRVNNLKQIIIHNGESGVECWCTKVQTSQCGLASHNRPLQHYKRCLGLNFSLHVLCLLFHSPLVWYSYLLLSYMYTSFLIFFHFIWAIIDNGLNAYTHLSNLTTVLLSYYKKYSIVLYIIISNLTWFIKLGHLRVKNELNLKLKSKLIF